MELETKEIVGHVWYYNPQTSMISPLYLNSFHNYSPHLIEEFNLLLRYKFMFGTTYNQSFQLFFLEKKLVSK